MSAQEKKILKNIKLCLAKKDKTLNNEDLNVELSEKTSKQILKIIYKTLTSSKALTHQKEAGKFFYFIPTIFEMIKFNEIILDIIKDRLYILI